jgi:hypothetical protein
MRLLSVDRFTVLSVLIGVVSGVFFFAISPPHFIIAAPRASLVLGSACVDESPELADALDDLLVCRQIGRMWLSLDCQCAELAQQHVLQAHLAVQVRI